MTAAALLRDLDAAGVVVWADGAALRLRADRPPPPHLLAEVRMFKADLLALLAAGAGTIGGDDENPPPLAFAREPRPWSYPATLPEPGDWCSCCKGRRFWTRDASPGWRCSVCHPPDSDWLDLRELRTGGETRCIISDREYRTGG